MRPVVHTTVALILISLYLLLPAAAFAHGTPLQEGKNCGVSVQVPVNSSPCDDCPCSETQDADCCESGSCCPCHAPLTQRMTIAYSPLISYLYHPESHPAPTQVYLSIFVPPQNISA